MLHDIDLWYLYCFGVNAKFGRLGSVQPFWCTTETTSFYSICFIICSQFLSYFLVMLEFYIHCIFSFRFLMYTPYCIVLVLQEFLDRGPQVY